MITRTLRGLTALLLGLFIAACSADIGPDEELLYGTWQQDGPTEAGDDIRVDKAVITYAPDGTSDFAAVMTVTANEGIPERFTIDADVSWTLEETILIRTLNDVTVTPDISTPEADALAAALAEEYRRSPPGRLIIESVDAAQLVLLDAANGQTLTYNKQ